MDPSLRQTLARLRDHQWSGQDPHTTVAALIPLLERHGLPHYAAALESPDPELVEAALCALEQRVPHRRLPWEGLFAAGLIVLGLVGASLWPRSGGGLQGSYFDTVEPAGGPVLKRLDEAFDFRWGTQSPPGLPADGFSAVWTGCIDIPRDDLELVVRADDGVRITIGDALWVDRWGAHAARYHRVYRPLPAGRHPIRIAYQELSGGASLFVGWGRHGQAHHPLPASALIPPRRCTP